MNSNYRIVIADDHSVIREGLRGIILNEPGFSIVGEAADGKEVLSLLKSVKCELVILDIAMPGKDGLEALKVIRKEYPELKVLILSMLKDSEHFRLAKKLGASGYLAKDDAADELVPALKNILKGREYVSPSLMRSLAERQIRTCGSTESPSLEILTKREIEILGLIANGRASKNIASELNISIHTVENHRAHIIEKLGIAKTASLVKYAIDKGLI